MGGCWPWSRFIHIFVLISQEILDYWLRLMPVLVILTRYYGDESNSEWGQGQRGGSSDQNFAPDPEYIWIYEYLTRLHLYVFVLSYKFMKQINTGQNWSRWELTSENSDSRLWDNSFWRSRFFVIVCCYVCDDCSCQYETLQKALLSQTYWLLSPNQHF